MHTALQTVVELALATTTGEDLRLDDRALLRCITVSEFGRARRTRVLTELLEGGSSLIDRLGRYTLRCWDAILRVWYELQFLEDRKGRTEFSIWTDWYS